VSECLGAFTEFAPTYAPYISINRDGGKVTIYIRGTCKADVWAGQPVVISGSEASITMEEGDFLRLWDDVNHRIRE
jgi:hypothetical protein